MDRNIVQISEEAIGQGNAEQWTIEGMPQTIRDAEESMGQGPHMIVLACRWRYFASKDLEGLKKLASNFDYRMVMMPCSGQVQANRIATALDSVDRVVEVVEGTRSSIQ